MLLDMNALLLLIAAASTGFDLPKEDSFANSDQEKMQGTWNVEKIEVGGMKMPADQLKMKLAVRGDVMTATHDNRQHEEEMKFKLTPDADPPQIDMKSSRMNNKLTKGIYRLDGDTLTLCINDGGERPKKFASNQAGNTVLIVLKRKQ